MNDKIQASNLKKYKRKIITATIIIISVALICSPFFVKNISLVHDGAGKFEIAECIAQILAALFVIVGTFIAVWQYYISSKSEIIRLETDKVQKAIDLSEYYKENVLYLYTIIRTVYQKSGIFDFLQKEKNRMQNFDAEEMHEIFSQNDLDVLQKKYVSEEYIKAMVELNEILNLHINGFKTDAECISLDGHNTSKIEVNLNKAMNDFSFNYVTKLLNNMEQFAMYFSHNIADESVVYQSLYPTYIEMCRTLYYDISVCSELGGPKLYRNVQWLYKKWLDKSNETKKNIREQETKNGTIPENIR